MSKRSWFPSIAAVYLAIVSVATAQTQTVGEEKQANKDLIAPGQLPALLEQSLVNSGKRMMGTDRASAVITGNLTDAKGTRSAQLTFQAPGLFSFREQGGKSAAFNGSVFQTSNGAAGSEYDSILESLLTHFPDAVAMQMAKGGTYRRVGSHFKAESNSGGGSRYWTLLAFTPANRPGLAKGTALQQDLLIAIDEQTGFVAEVRSVGNPGTPQRLLVQTRFEKWTELSTGQWFPASITRYEAGKQVLQFQVQQAAVGIAGDVTKFVP